MHNYHIVCSRLKRKAMFKAQNDNHKVKSN